MIPAKKDVIFYNAQYSMMEYYLNDVLVKELITSSRDGARNHLERQGHRRNIEETGHQSDSSMLTWRPYWVGDVSWLLCKQDDGVRVILRQ